jgi:CubicO group peptidase (beta-lactamase class C family)
VRDVLQQTSGLDDLAGGPLLASAADGTPLAAIGELEDAELASTPGETWRYPTPTTSWPAWSSSAPRA